MKPKSNPFLRHASLIVAALALTLNESDAANGTWNVDANGLWSLDANWLSNTIADGSGFTASFTNNITADRTVSLDGDRTLTNLVFSDSNTATAGSWILDNNGTSTNNLILAGTTPTITVNALGAGKTATISAIIEGSAGLTKAGAGTLVLSGVNTYTGLTTVSVGALALTGTNGGNSNIVLSNNVTLAFNSGAALGTGSLLGQNGGVSNYGVGATFQTLGTTPISIGLSTAAGIRTASNGDANIKFTSGTGSTAAITWNTDFNIYATGNQTVTVDNVGGVTFAGKFATATFGSSTGTAIIKGSQPVSIGGTVAKTGTNTTGLTYAGTSTLTLSGANTYTGTTTIQAGSMVAGANSAVSTNGAFGNASSAIVLGNGSTTSSDAPSLLINGTFTVGRDITVGSLANTAAYNATIGGSNTSGTSTYTGNITLNTTASAYTATLQAATGGSVEFKTGTWTTNNKAIAIGSSGSTGTVILSNAITTSGGISVNYGTLALNNTLTGGMSVSGGATLSGTGTITGATTIGAAGKLSPTAQASGSKMSLGNTLAFDSGGTSIFNWDLSANTADPVTKNEQGDYGQVAVTGAASNTAVFNIVLLGGPGKTSNYADAFWDTNKTWNNIFSSSSMTDLTALFTSFTGAGLNPSGSGSSAIATAAGQGYFGFTGTTLNWTAVPEPTGALAGLLIGGGLLRRRRA